MTIREFFENIRNKIKGFFSKQKALPEETHVDPISVEEELWQKQQREEAERVKQEAEKARQEAEKAKQAAEIAKQKDENAKKLNFMSLTMGADISDSINAKIRDVLKAKGVDEAILDQATRIVLLAAEDAQGTGLEHKRELVTFSSGFGFKPISYFGKTSVLDQDVVESVQQDMYRRIYDTFSGEKKDQPGLMKYSPKFKSARDMRMVEDFPAFYGGIVGYDQYTEDMDLNDKAKAEAKTENGISPSTKKEIERRDWQFIQGHDWKLPQTVLMEILQNNPTYQRRKDEILSRVGDFLLEAYERIQISEDGKKVEFDGTALEYDGAELAVGFSGAIVSPDTSKRHLSVELLSDGRIESFDDRTFVTNGVFDPDGHCRQHRNSYRRVIDANGNIVESDYVEETGEPIPIGEDRFSSMKSAFHQMMSGIKLKVLQRSTMRKEGNRFFWSKLGLASGEKGNFNMSTYVDGPRGLEDCASEDVEISSEDVTASLFERFMESHRDKTIEDRDL